MTTSRLLACLLLMVALGACAGAPQEPRKMVIVPSASLEDEEACPGITGYSMIMPDGATINIEVITNLGPQTKARGATVEAD